MTTTVDGGDWLSTLTLSPSPRLRRSATQNKTTGDYLAAIRATKAYLDPLWDAPSNCHKIPTDYSGLQRLDGGASRSYCLETWGNAWWLQTVAILAGYDAAHSTSFASSTDKSRAITLANQFAGTTGSVWGASVGTWYHQMDGVDRNTEGCDHAVAQALYYAYKYRTALGWTSGTGPADALDKLTVDRACTGIYNGRTLSLNGATSPYDNQSMAYWQFNRMAYSHLLGTTPADLDNCIKFFIDNIDRTFNAGNPGAQKGNYLYPDFGWLYTDATGPWPSWEYGSMCVGGALIFAPELDATLGLSTTQKNRMKAWSRQILGQWQVNGYPNWDTSWSNSRMHSLAYWMHGALSLVAIARNESYWNQNSGDAAIAKGILDNLIDTYRAMDTFRSDSRDGAVARFPTGSDLYSGYAVGYDQTWNWDKFAFNAKYCALLAMAVDLGVADQTGTHSPNVFTWQWERQPLHVSTPNYSAGIVPYAPPIGSSFGGTDSGVNAPDHVQLQHWGPAHVQTPGNRWLTALGGMGAGHAFVAQVIRNGVTEVDTSTTPPTTRNVYRDGVQINAAKTAYSTTAIPTNFVTSLQHTASGGVTTNYSLTVDTIFYADRFETTYTVTRTDAVGTVSLNLEMPCRSGVTMKAHDGSTLTTIWDGTTGTTKTSPSYVHQTYGSYGLLWKVSDLSGFTSSAQSKAVSAAVYERETDRGRSTQLTLSAGTLNTSASVKVTGYITNGGNQDANHKAGIS